MLTLNSLEQQARDGSVSFEAFLNQLRASFTHKCCVCGQAQAVLGAPRSDDQGKTVNVYGYCAAHTPEKVSAASWDGRYLEVDLVHQPNVIVFHDRGIGRELRHFIGGKVIANDDEVEMLYEDLTRGVEKQVAAGQLSGITEDPCYPDWYLTYIPA